MHGYEHLYITTSKGLFSPNTRSEFAGTEITEQRRRLRLGYKVLVKTAASVRVHSWRQRIHSTVRLSRRCVLRLQLGS